VELAGAEFGAGFDSASKNFSHLKGAESVMFDEFASKVGEDLSGCFRGEESTQGVRER